LVGGGFSKSRFGFVIPAASLISVGIVLAVAKIYHSDWSLYAALIVVAMAIGLLINKSLEYQKARNEALKKPFERTGGNTVLY